MGRIFAAACATALVASATPGATQGQPPAPRPNVTALQAAPASPAVQRPETTATPSAPPAPPTPKTAPAARPSAPGGMPMPGTAGLNHGEQPKGPMTLAAPSSPRNPASPAVVAAARPFLPPGTRRDRVRAIVFQEMGDYFPNGVPLTPQTLALGERRFEARVRAQRMAQVMAADLDADGEVSEDELTELLRGRHAMPEDRIKAIVANTMKLSSNGKTVSVKDLASAPLPNALTNRWYTLAKAALGASQSLTQAGFEQSVIDAFDALDANHDGVLDMSEYLAGSAHPRLAPGTPVPSPLPGGHPQIQGKPSSSEAVVPPAATSSGAPREPVVAPGANGNANYAPASQPSTAGSAKPVAATPPAAIPIQPATAAPKPTPASPAPPTPNSWGGGKP